MVRNIEIDETAMAALRQLQAQALRRGVALGPYLQTLAQHQERGGVVETQEQAKPKETSEQWIARLREWAASHKTLTHEVDDSRESIYPDRT